MLGCQIGFWRVHRIFREISVTQGLMEPKLHILYCSRFLCFTPPFPLRAARPSASSVSRWLVRRLVGLQFCQRAYHRSHFAVWSIAFVSAATDEIEALAKIEHPFRGDAGDAGGIQPHCSGRALSQ